MPPFKETEYYQYPWGPQFPYLIAYTSFVPLFRGSHYPYFYVNYSLIVLYGLNSHEFPIHMLLSFSCFLNFKWNSVYIFLRHLLFLIYVAVVHFHIICYSIICMQYNLSTANVDVHLACSCFLLLRMLLWTLMCLLTYMWVSPSYRAVP